jgi:hypothetical protein
LPAPSIDIFCHVVDNLGDVGVCWRFCKALARDQGCYVRLFVDDFDAFAKIEPRSTRLVKFSTSNPSKSSTGAIWSSTGFITVAPMR